MEVERPRTEAESGRVGSQGGAGNQEGAGEARAVTLTALIREESIFMGIMFFLWLKESERENSRHAIRS